MKDELGKTVEKKKTRQGSGPNGRLLVITFVACPTWIWAWMGFSFGLAATFDFASISIIANRLSLPD